VAWGLEVTASGLCQADERLAEKAEPVYQELVEALRDSVAVHADETGWRVGGQGAGLWVFTGPRGTVYTINGRRSHEVVVEVLGPEFSGVWVTDCFRAYDHRGSRSVLPISCGSWGGFSGRRSGGRCASLGSWRGFCGRPWP